jgi:uncharacterized membrane protein (UPF0127 family)
MGKKEITIKYKKKRLKIAAEDCNLLNKIVGLMFSRREKSRILLFDFKRKQKIKIHSLFVFYSFIALWLDGKNRVVDLKIVRPFTLCVSPKKPVFKLVEIPINNFYKKIIITLLVGNQKHLNIRVPKK